MKLMPIVSVIVACRNVEPFIGVALDSLLKQRLDEIEVIVIDDNSDDGTALIVQTYAQADPRVKIIKGYGMGPAAARNAGISVAQGEWIAVVDGDDFVHLDRFANLLSFAERMGADIVADELIAFTEDANARHAWPFLSDELPIANQSIALADLLRSPKTGSKESPLGYLKPMVKLQFLRLKDVTYDESLTIGEDFDFLTRLLTLGAKMFCVSEGFYFYRRHSNSISHRLSAAHAKQMEVASATFRERFSKVLLPEDKKHLEQRHARLVLQTNTQILIESLKAKDVARCMSTLFRSPEAGWRTAGFAIEGFARRLLHLLPAARKTLQSHGFTLSVVSHGMGRVLPAQQAEKVLEAPDVLDVKSSVIFASQLFSASYRAKASTFQNGLDVKWRGYVRSGRTFEEDTRTIKN